MSAQELCLETTERGARSARSLSPSATPAATPSLSSPLAERQIEPDRPTYAAVKSGLEFAAAVLLMIVALPVILVAAAIVRLTSSGPAFFRQTRVGKGGREFRIWKLRTMAIDAEARSGPVWSVVGDPRVTPFGRFLRASHIDEFPQLFNVLAGDMDLIGPRPERPEFVRYLEWQLAGYRQRLNVRPGITGLAQMLLPPDTDLESVRRKLDHDLYYVQHVSLWLDLRILLHTAWVLIAQVAAAMWAPFRLPESEMIFAQSVADDQAG